MKCLKILTSNLFSASAYRNFYGDVMLIHATKDLRKGEEVTHSYVHPSKEYAKRCQTFTKQWGFTCDCRLCELDKVDPECSKRAKIVKEFWEFAEANHEKPAEVILKGKDVLEQVRVFGVKNAEQLKFKPTFLKSQLRSTYNQRHELKIDLIRTLSIMCAMYSMVKDTTSCLKCWDECSELAKDGPTKELRLEDVALNVACCLAHTGEGPRAREFVCKAFEMSFARTKSILRRCTSLYRSWFFKGRWVKPKVVTAVISDLVSHNDMYLI